MARILVIEDDPIYREMVQEALSDEGHEIILAENGEEGIERARAYLPDLVLSDVVMDRADGYQVLATLRNEPSTAGIPFIMMTGWSSKGGQRQGMAQGADDYLAKPFNATELIDAVSAQLRKKSRATTQAARADSVSEISVSELLPAEISRPLQSLQGYGQILRRSEVASDPKAVAAIGQQVSEAAWRIQRAMDNFVLFNQLLSLEQKQDITLYVPAQPTDHIGELVETRVLNIARSRGREADVRLQKKDGKLSIAPEFLTRLLDELIDNAIKFSEPGDAIEVVCAFAPNRFGIAVTDHGKGMSEEQIRRVDAFIQFGKTERERAGLGLGLAIARKIALLHGGALSIKSKEGEKTRVAVELPIR